MFKKNIKILFFGTSIFALPALQKLIENNYEIAYVITQPDKPIGRKQILEASPIKKLALKYRLEVLQPEKLDASFLSLLQIGSANALIITASYGKIIPKKILDFARIGALNLHPSLLPKYRGPSPIQTAILNGDKKTGATIILMDEKMDHGNILAQKVCDIANSQKFADLQKKLSEINANLLISTIPKWINKEINPKKQDHSKATYTKIIKKNDGKIDWNEDAKKIKNKLRAFTPWPGCFAIFKNNSQEKRVKILNVSIEKNPCLSLVLKPGQISRTEDKKMAVKCGLKNEYLIIEDLQMEGKKIMKGEDFLNGYADVVLFV